MKRATARRGSGEAGFTLVELLVVIVILGILAAVVVFAVGGITDKGQTAACKTDKRTLETAEEANFAQNDEYVSEADLVTNKFLEQESDLHNISASADEYDVSPVSGGKCDGITA